ncbi:MAG: alpha-E domain-containing protein, partial [Pseudomonadota bacterium]
MMLGRTANGLFWMFRYLERAENTARLLEAGLRMALTRDLVSAQEEWRSVIATSGQRALFESTHEAYDGHSAWNFVLRDKTNPANVREMFGAVRSNARVARTNISSEVWEAVNESWIKLDGLLARPVSQSAVGDAVATIKRAATRVHGALDGSMLRNESYHFARAGTYIERAESTARILDLKYFLLLPSL